MKNLFRTFGVILCAAAIFENANAQITCWSDAAGKRLSFSISDPMTMDEIQTIGDRQTVSSYVLTDDWTPDSVAQFFSALGSQKKIEFDDLKGTKGEISFLKTTSKIPAMNWQTREGKPVTGQLPIFITCANGGQKITPEINDVWIPICERSDEIKQRIETEVGKTCDSIDRLAIRTYLLTSTVWDFSNLKNNNILDFDFVFLDDETRKIPVSIDLSKSNLNTFPAFTGFKTSKDSNINLSHNKLQTLSQKIPEIITYGGTMDLSFNEINFSEGDEFFKAWSVGEYDLTSNWPKLVLDHNKISSFPPDTSTFEVRGGLSLNNNLISDQNLSSITIVGMSKYTFDHKFKDLSILPNFSFLNNLNTQLPKVRGLFGEVFVSGNPLILDMDPNKELDWFAQRTHFYNCTGKLHVAPYYYKYGDSLGRFIYLNRCQNIQYSSNAKQIVMGVKGPFPISDGTLTQFNKSIVNLRIESESMDSVDYLNTNSVQNGLFNLEMLNLKGSNLVEKYIETLSSASVSFITSNIIFTGGRPKSFSNKFWLNLPNLRSLFFVKVDFTALNIHDFDVFIARKLCSIGFMKDADTGQRNRMTKAQAKFLQAAGKLSDHDLAEEIELVGD